MRALKIKIVSFVALLVALMALPSSASAQHTLTLTGGTGLSTARFYPAEVTKWKWGSETFGLSWRFYSDKPRFVGAVGIDLEYIERGYQVGYTYTSKWVGEGDNKREERTYQFYDRDVSTIMLPLVWQPHVYAARNRLRIFIEAAVVLSFNISSRYDYLDGKYEGGKYEWKVPRDNRFGYGLSGGAGFAVLLGQVEVGFKARYSFGYSDILKNRNKYYSNSTDGRENPFYYTPLRSPMDNINIMLTVGWRFNKRGFDEWFVVRPKREKRLDDFNFSAQTGASQGGGTQSGGQQRSR